MIGKTISHYRILEKLGEGGMGVVYKAEDTKLKRHVALKFLPTNLTADEEAKERFVQEAQTASALDHPNICTIYEINQTEDGQMFIAMAYYGGETLKQKIAEGQLSTESIIDITYQIAQGLAKAHQHGIIHRDIKPANIIVTDDGLVKILDFGLAKLVGQARLTRAGATIGTVAYMSPEQVRGEDVDHRTDIWSFGVVLFEMITGQLPFKGEYEQAMSYSIVNEEPESVLKFRPDLSSKFLPVLNRTLEKEPERRYQSAQETLIDLKRLKRDEKKPAPVNEVLVSKSEEIKQVRPTKLSKKNILFVGTLIGACIMVLVAIDVFKPFSKKSYEPPTTIPLTSFLGDEQRPAFSPNGSQIAFMWNGENQDNFDIYVKEIGVSGYPTRLTHHPGYDFCPVWSPDDKFIVFGRRYVGKDDIYVMSALGKAERKFCETNWKKINYLAWSDNGRFLAVSAQDSSQNPYRIYLLSTDTFEIKGLTLPTDLSHNDYECAISPDNKGCLNKTE